MRQFPQENIALESTVKQDSQDLQELQDIHREPTTNSAVTSFASAYHLPLASFLRWAHEHYLDFDDGEAWQSPLWSFVRLVKGHPDMISLRSNAALKVIEKTLVAWKGRL